MYTLRQLLRLVFVLVLVAVTSTPLQAQRRIDRNAPNSLNELRQRINAEQHLPASRRTRTISYFHKFKTRAARELLLKLLQAESDAAVLNAVMGQLRNHSHRSVVKALKRAFLDRAHAGSKTVLRSAAYALAGQGKAGVVFLVQELKKPRSELHLQAAVYGLQYGNAKSGAQPALRKLLTNKRYAGNKDLLNAVAAAIAQSEGSAVEFLIEAYGRTDNHNLQKAILHGLRTSKGNDKKVLKLLRGVFEDPRYDRDMLALNDASYAISRRGNAGLELLLAILKKPSGEYQRKAAIYALRYVANKTAAFAALTDLFETSEPAEHYEILMALGSFRNNPALVPLLLKALSSKSPEARAEAIYQLGMRDHPQARSAALQLAKEKKISQQASLRGKVAYALIRVMEPSDMAVVLKLSQGAERYLGNRLTSLRNDKNKKLYPRFVKNLAEVVTNAGPEVERYTALNLLIGCSGKQVERALLDSLRSDSPRIVTRAMQTLVQRKDKRVAPHLETFLQSDSEDIRLEAMIGLHEFRKGSPAWPRQLMKIVRESGDATGFAAIGLLADLQYKPALPLAHRMFDHEKWQVRSVAYDFCRRVRDISSVPLLIGRLDKETGRLQHEVAQALRELTHLTYKQAQNWQQWWDSSKATFKLPVEAPRKGSGAARPVAAAMTYYSLPLFSNRVCFVVDTSGSMTQKVGTAQITRLTSAKQALRGVLDKCKPDFEFNVVHFSTGAKQWKKELLAADDKNKFSARKFVKALTASGGTNVHDALKMAFEDMKVDTIYLLSDGYPSAGPITDIHQLADEVQLWNARRRIIIHTISIGSDSELLKRLAEESGGTYVRRI